jgi:hypothetical protein
MAILEDILWAIAVDTEKACYSQLFCLDDQAEIDLRTFRELIITYNY